ncbi:MAG: SprB repeat-containing protein, partial [Bacteroidia bacterium]|nr:SprB repeat-containing protein [Bacteroidia bacterium]
TQITTSMTSINVMCYGASTGSIDLSVSGGISPYTYHWSGSQTTEDLSNIPAGSYLVTITDTNGCTATASKTITQPTLISTSVTGTNVMCYGASTGSIDLTVSGGISPYTYHWSGSQTTEDLSNIPAGSYLVTVTDTNGCTATASKSITQPTQISTSITIINVLCYGASTGSIDLTVSGGISPYAFHWSGSQTTEDLSNIPAGSYLVTVTDTNGCTATASKTITQPTQISTSVTSINVLCYGASTGSIDLTVSGGITPYAYHWSNGPSIEDLSNLPTGSYLVTVTDANGCTVTASKTITQPTQISTSVTSINVLCFGASTGSINLSVSGGISPYLFHWSNSQTTQNLSNLPAGSYLVTVTDANGCTATASKIITQSTQITTSISSINVMCYGDSNGSIDLTVNGGSSSYTYLWSDGPITQDLFSLPAGTYIVTVTDNKGCTSTASGTINQPDSLIAIYDLSPVLCFGNNATVIISATGGVEPYSGDVGTFYDPAGDYYFDVFDANGCFSEVEVDITSPPLLTLTSTGNNVSCYGTSTGSITLTVSGGTAPFACHWSNGQTNQNLNNLTAGNYFVTVTDANGCTATASKTLTQPSLISRSLTGINVLCNGASTGSITLTVNGGSSPYSFHWSNG